MSIRLLIADSDESYAEHLSKFLSQKHPDTFDVSVCSQNLPERLAARAFDVALIDGALLDAGVDLSPVKLPVLLWDDKAENQLSGRFDNLEKARKYQRISSLISDVLESYAKVTPAGGAKLSSGSALVTAVYSPSGGSGKTTVAMTYATKQSAAGVKTLYLCLEPFASTPVYFDNNGKSISGLLSGLEGGNTEFMIRSICRQDERTGIMYFCTPKTFDDMDVMTRDELETLLKTIVKSGICQELVLDLTTACDCKCRCALEFADRVLLVSDPSQTAQAKLTQFMTQHNVFESIRPKTTLVVNKGGTPKHTRENIGSHVFLPSVSSGDSATVCKALSDKSFAEGQA